MTHASTFAFLVHPDVRLAEDLAPVFGIPDLDQVDHVKALARDHAALGFTTAAPTSFGTPIARRRVATEAAAA